MADDLDKQLDVAYQNHATESSLDAAYDAATGGGPEHGSLLSGMAASAVHAGTLHADSYVTTPEWQKKTENFPKKHPILAGVGEAAGILGGIVGSAYIPGAQATLPARGAVAAGRLAKAWEYLTPFGNFTRAAAPGVTWKEAAKEGAKGSVKLGMANRFNDPAKTPDEITNPFDLSGTKIPIGSDPVNRLSGNIWQKSANAVDLPSMAWDAGGGAVMAPVGNAVGGFIGNRIASLGQAATLGNLPKRGAVLDLKHEMERDSTGGGVDGAIERIRNLVYGEDRTLGQHGGGAIPQEAERKLAAHFQRLTERGYTDAEAERLVGAALERQARSASSAVTGQAPGSVGPAMLQRPGGAIGPPSHPNAWLLSAGGAGPRFTPGTMGGWARTAGEAYRDRNAIPANLTELTALANGGEAPALQSTLRKLLNLKSDGPERSTMLRGLRDRQKGIKPQMEGVLSRRLGDGDVGTAIAEHADRAKAANALYAGIYDDARAIPDSAQRLQEAIRPAIDAAMAKAGNKTDALSQALRSEAQKFLVTTEVPGAGSETALSGLVTKNVKDAAGNIVSKIQRQVPLTKETLSGGQVTTKINPGGVTKEMAPAGDLESIVALRRALKDQVDTAYRGGSKNLGHDLKEFHDSIDKAVRGLSGNDPLGQIVGKWAAANDTRAYAGRLERTYADALGLNLSAKKGGGLMELERFHARFRNMDEAEKDIARRGIMGQFKAMLETGGDLHDAAKIFSNTRTRDILTNLFTDSTVKDKAAARRAAKEVVDELGGHFARGGLATNTFNMNKGSQTASIVDADKEGGWLSNIAGAIWHGNPLRAIGHMGEMAGDALKRKKHADMTGLLSADTSNPARLEEVLANIKRAAAPVNQRLQNIMAQGRPVGTAAGVAIGKRRDE